MSERDLKLVFSADASGMAKGTADVKKQLENIKNVADSLRGGFQAFAAGRGLAMEMSEAMNGSATAIAAVAGNMANLATGIMTASRVGGTFGGVMAALIASLGIYSGMVEKQEAEAKNWAEALQKDIDKINALRDSITQSGKKNALAESLKEITRIFNELKAKELDKGIVVELDVREATRKADVLKKHLQAMQDEALNNLTPQGVGEDNSVIKSHMRKLIEGYISSQITGAQFSVRDFIPEWMLGRTMEGTGDTLWNSIFPGKPMDKDASYRQFEEGILSALKGYDFYGVKSQLLDVESGSRVAQSKQAAEKAQLEAEAANKPTVWMLTTPSTKTDYLTNELQRIGGYMGGNVYTTLTTYETQSLQVSKEQLAELRKLTAGKNDGWVTQSTSLY